MNTIAATNADRLVERGQAVELVDQQGRSVAGRFMGLVTAPVRGRVGVCAKLRGARGAHHYVLIDQLAEVTI